MVPTLVHDQRRPFKGLHVLCAGAVQGLVKAVQPRFEAAAGTALHARFGAVGAMREALLGGEPCDVLIVTAAMVDALCDDGNLRRDTRAAIGAVSTGIAVPSGHALPDVKTADSLKAALLAADMLYCPDAVKSTAGIHFTQVLQRLGIHDAVAARLSTHPNGAMAMRALADAQTPRPIGCTQLTEILATRGVQAVGRLPQQLELTTVYSAAVTSRTAAAAVAGRFIALLAGDESASTRVASGFDP